MEYNQDSHLPILAITTETRREPFTFWQASLDGLQYPTGRRHIVYLSELDPAPGYCTASWTASASPGSGQRWLQEVVNHVANHQGERFICSGPGVQFLPLFNEAQQRWKNLMDDGRLDLLFVAERRGPLREQRLGEVGTMFFLVECNKRTLLFWQQALVRQQAEPVMAGHQPREAQFHINSLLTYRAGSGAQDGDLGVRWDFVPAEDTIWTEFTPPSEAASAQNVASVQIATGTKSLEDLRTVFDLVSPSGHATHKQKHMGKSAAEAAKAEAFMIAEVEQITAEITRLRQELLNAPRDELDRHQASLGLAAAELLDEVERLKGDFVPPSLLRPEVFEAVD